MLSFFLYPALGCQIGLWALDNHIFHFIIFDISGDECAQPMLPGSIILYSILKVGKVR